MKNAFALFAIFSVWTSTSALSADVKLEGGLIVCVGAEALEGVSEDWKRPGFVFQCLETSDEAVFAARRKIQEAGCYGKVSVIAFDGKRLPYINNLVNTILVSPGYEIPDEEIQRALAPYGSAVVDGQVIVKPYPEEMDEWPQYLHGADNNCVAEDSVVGPPRHVQWIGGPAWTRSHMGAASITSMVSSGGRLFTIEDTATAENPFLPSQWQLIARSAFNGVQLWTMDLPVWENATVYIKRYHAQMQRRLVAMGDAVYCTPSLDAPVTALEAATGKVIREFEGTVGTQEFVYHDGRLFVVIGDRMHFNGYEPVSKGSRKKGKKKKKAKAEPVTPPVDPDAAFKGKGFASKLYNPRRVNAADPQCVIAAFDASTGEEIWRTDGFSFYIGCSVALKGDRLVYQTRNGLVCLDAGTGKENWSVEKEINYGVGSSPNTVVLSDEAVVAEEGSQVFAYSLADGSDLWGKGLKARKGYQASTDLMITGDALWMCGAGGTPTSYDLKTGALIKTIPQTLSKPMGHDRCFRNFITERFFINSKTGGPDCLDLVSDTEFPAPFTRATCSMGALPANGLIYAGPYACQCHLTVGLHNFNVYYTNEEALPTQGQKIRVKRKIRLEKGPAYGESGDANDAPWPTYRQDPRRYSASETPVPAVGLKTLWKTKLGPDVTAPVIAEGKIFVAETEAHRLRALDASTGENLWETTVGGRIDSPPTYHRGLLIFGSRDGWVHCVRAGDGALSWSFKDLPDKLISAFGQVESAWPVNGSALVVEDIAYFCAGRSSYLDGGLFLYGLDPVTGEVIHERRFYGPYAEDGFPAFREEGDRSETEVLKGTTADVMSHEGNTLYIRHQAFNLDLTDGKAGKHLLSSAGFLESERHHREYTLVKEAFNHRKAWTTEQSDYPTGDIVVSDGTDYYSVMGMEVNRHSSFDPRENGYALQARTRSATDWSSKWNTRIPITGKAMTLTGDTIFVAGAPLIFDPEDPAGTYEGRRGGVLWATSGADGSKLAEYKLDVIPAWDGMATAYGRLFIVNQAGEIECWGTE